MKKILLIVAVFLCLLIPTKISALTDSFRTGEYIPNTYIKKMRNGSGRYEQMVVFRRNSDNKPVYCIELWESLADNQTLTGYDSNQASLANMSKSTWNRVSLLAYYGYGYQNHTDIKWYAVTQFMIWKTIATDSNIYFTDTLNGNYIDRYSDEIAELNNLVNAHSITPSFDNLLNVYYNQEYTYVDNNAVLDQYDFTPVAGLNLKKTSNSIVFTDSNIGYTKINLIKKDKMYENNPIVYINSVGQDVLLPGSYEQIVFQVFFELRSRNVTINKLDKDNYTNIPSGEATLKGVKFEIYDINHNYMQTVETNEVGQAIIRNMPYGKFYIKEVKAGTGYLINNSETEIDVNSAYGAFNITNEVIKNKIIINKYLKNKDGTVYKEKASFILLNKSNEIVKEFETIDGVYELELPYGNYILRQVSGEKNYKFIDDLNINVSENAKIQELDLYNNQLVVPIRINNIDYDSELNILEEGATFTIKNIDTQEEIRLTTNSNGETITINLLPGNYQITQLTSVDGYLMNDREYTLEINEDNYTFDTDTVIINIPNVKEKAEIEVDKLIRNYLNDELIDQFKQSNIIVPIYAKNDIYSKDGVLVYNKDQEVDNKELVYGTYYINNPSNSEPVDINLNRQGIKKVEIIEDNYKYLDNKKISGIPDTYVETKKINYNLILVLMGLLLVYKGKDHEED